MLLEEMKIFTAISKSRSFSQAAKQLHISRPALSKKIESLEYKYGVKLYNRTSQGVTLTKAGRIITEYAVRFIDINNEMDQELAALQESFLPTLTIGASYADGTYLLPSLIKSFYKKNPDSRIHLEVGYEPELLNKMQNSQIDFSIIEDQCIFNDFHCQLLGYKRLICLAPNIPPWSELRKPVEVRKLLPLPMIIYEWESGRHYIGDQHFRKYHGYRLKDYNVVVRLDTYEAMIEGIRSGLGFGLFPEEVAKKYLYDSRIICLDLKTEPIYYQVNLVYYKMKDLSLEAKAFIQFIQDNYPQDYFEKIAKEDNSL